MVKKLRNTFFLFLLSISFYAQTPPPIYYDDVDLNARGMVLFEELTTKIISTHVGIPYTSSSSFDVWDTCRLG